MGPEQLDRGAVELVAFDPPRQVLSTFFDAATSASNNAMEELIDGGRYTTSETRRSIIRSRISKPTAPRAAASGLVGQEVLERVVTVDVPAHRAVREPAPAPAARPAAPLRPRGPEWPGLLAELTRQLDTGAVYARVPGLGFRTRGSARGLPGPRGTCCGAR